ncbi:hypothetical protein [Roseivivax sp. CAU 1753]
MADTLDLNDKPVPAALWQVSAPMAFGILGVLSVGLADSYFLARAGQDALAAIGFILPGDRRRHLVVHRPVGGHQLRDQPGTGGAGR